MRYQDVAGLLFGVEGTVRAGRRERWRGVIAIDGPSASGKSTLARRLASDLGLACLDTGAFYRAAALAALRCGVDVDDEGQAIEAVRQARITQEDGRTRLGGEDVEAEIRTPAVTEMSSRVAVLAGVRKILVERQRQWVEDRGGAAVVEGRDIGSVVFPDAPVKVFLNADPGERARRRMAESTGGQGLIQVEESLAERDSRDTDRVVSPLLRMPDAVMIDTTALNPEEAAAQVLNLIDFSPAAQ